MVRIFILLLKKILVPYPASPNNNPYPPSGLSLCIITFYQREGKQKGRGEEKIFSRMMLIKRFSLAFCWGVGGKGGGVGGGSSALHSYI